MKNKILKIVLFIMSLIYIMSNVYTLIAYHKVTIRNIIMLLLLLICLIGLIILKYKDNKWNVKHLKCIPPRGGSSWGFVYSLNIVIYPMALCHALLDR